jgi:hypothetical protein
MHPCERRLAADDRLEHPGFVAVVIHDRRGAISIIVDMP